MKKFKAILLLFVIFTTLRAEAIQNIKIEEKKKDAEITGKKLW